ncbi:MAG TPA: NPCBM/NEW2 domain-containing protein [Acidobacteriota bacterium]|nr:NPCBM/NEW2 domain-containing protein [Acidobacteriota bacterium]
MRHRGWFAVILCCWLVTQAVGQDRRAWPYPIPCRIQDGSNPDLFLMVLGDVNTSLAQGTFDPAKDQVILSDGTVKPDYYKNTLGLPYYKPIDKTHFALPPSGWCTWYFYYYHITADEVKRNARWISENLKDYGARFIQIDDGWQRSPEMKSTRDWTWIHKDYFPGGMADVAAYIKSVGLVPGIWLAPHGQDNPDVIKRNPKVFLLKPDGTSASSTWEGKWLVDPTTPESESYMKTLFTKLRDWGYEYFKIDGQPIVVDEYTAKQQFMVNKPSENGAELYRRTLGWVREVIGADRYLLGCWGIPTQGAGIMDGSRTGGDIVLGWGGLQTALSAVMGFYYQHNVMWYVDPDVMVLRSPLTVDQARVWATLQGLTGQALMATDRMMDLGEERVEMLRRVYPAVDIRPLDLFPAQRHKRIWDLKINHLGRAYDVIGVFNFGETNSEQITLKWSDLGLPSDKPLHVFDFWNKDYLGAWEAGMTLDVAPTSCRVLTVLPSNGKIQLISTNRHITQGWVDLAELKYDDAAKAYSGKSHVIKNDPYELQFVFPRDRNFEVKSVSARAGTAGLPATFANHQGWATVKIRSSQTADVMWRVQFEPAAVYSYPVAEPTNLRVERAGLDGINLTWSEQYYLNAGYKVYLDGKLQGYTPKAAFQFRGLDPKAEHTAAVETVWEDGVVSKRKAETTFSIKAMAPKQMSLSQLQPIRSSGGDFGVMGPWAKMSSSGPVSIAGKFYPDAISVQPGSNVTYQINGLYSTLTALVGVGSESAGEESIEFVAAGDGKEIWRSGKMTKVDVARPAQIDVTGIQRLVLRIEDGATPAHEIGRGEARRRIQAAWIEAVLSKKD